MALSGSANYSVTRNDLVKGALRICGALAQGETPTADQYTEGYEALNLMIKAFIADGMQLWAIKQHSVTLTSTVNTYRIGEGQTVNIAKPLRIIQAYFHNGTTNVDVPMTLLTREEYNRLGNKTTPGNPNQFYYDPQRTYGDLYLYPTPDGTAASGSVTIVYQKPFDDVESDSDEMDFPYEWFEALKFNLALRLAPEYGVPTEQYSMIRSLAKESKDAALNFGAEEGSFSFEPFRYTW